MKLTICLSERFIFKTFLPFIKILIKNNISVQIIHLDNKSMPAFYIIENQADLTNIDLYLDNFERRCVKKSNPIIPKINFKGSYNISLTRLILHIIYPLINYLGLSKFINIYLEKKILKIFEKFNSSNFLKNSDLIFALSDRNLWIDLCLAKYADGNNIPLAIPYYVRQVGPEILQNKSSYYNIRSKTYKYYPSFIASFIKKSFNVDSDNALTVGKLFDAYICCNNKDTKNRFISYGLNKKKLPVLGDINFLRIRKIYKQKKEYIVLSMPHFFEHNMVSKTKHFFIIEELLKKLSKSRFEVLISLHPKSNINNYKNISDKYNMRIIEDFNLIELLYNAKYFVCTFSSTYRLALDFRKPVVVLDHILSYSKYDKLDTNKYLTIITEKNAYEKFSFVDYEKNIPNYDLPSLEIVSPELIINNYLDFIYSFKKTKNNN